jgi:isopenicillin-N epimerase
MSIPDWAVVREQMMLDPTCIYLNTGSYGIVPRPVFETVQALRERMYRQPTDFLWREAGEPLWQARVRLGQFLHAEPKRLVFTANVSSSINIVAQSLRLAAPGEILTTDHEYGAMFWAWERAAVRQGLVLRACKFPVAANDPQTAAEAIIAEIRPETRLLFLSHVYFTTGLILPIKEICAAARKRGVLTVIDAAHAPGMIPLNLDDIGADFYTANLHKWLLAPLGTGILYSAPGQDERLDPLHASWGWHYDRTKANERDEYGGTPRLRSHEFEGSRDITPWLAVPATIDFHEKLGAENIRRRHHELSEHARRTLDGHAGLRLVTPSHPAMRGGLTAFKSPPCDPLAVRQEIWRRHRIEFNFVPHPDGPWLRLSCHFFNTEAEIDRLAAVLPEFLPK